MTQTEFGAHSPREIASLVESVGIAKARLELVSLLHLAVLAGAFISLGAMFFIVTITESTWGFGVTRLIGGLAFSLGLILVVIAGAELFTGNNLIAIAWASRKVTTAMVLRNWFWVYLGNVAGCLGTVALVLLGNLGQLGGGAVGESVVEMARAKVNLGWIEMLARGILCNALVCLAVWLAMGSRSVADKILAIVFPITAFVTMGLEHSIANWFILPLGMAL
ncbi:MAG TPA: formate/nitrite transporter family protein, partial [Pirellulaceae bacterium]|nr:formate/nitrite transporter family protein [Pirellulaceae bacterium]